jgi:hypothetical protein
MEMNYVSYIQPWHCRIGSIGEAIDGHVRSIGADEKQRTVAGDARGGGQPESSVHAMEQY